MFLQYFLITDNFQRFYIYLYKYFTHGKALEIKNHLRSQINPQAIASPSQFYRMQNNIVINVDR